MKFYQRQHLIWVLWCGLLLKASCETQHGKTEETSRPTSGKPPEDTWEATESGASKSSPLISTLNGISFRSRSQSTQLPPSLSETNELTHLLKDESGFDGAIESSETSSRTTQGYKSTQGATTGNPSSLGTTTQKIQTEPPDDQQSTINNSQKTSFGGSTKGTQTLTTESESNNAQEKSNALDKKNPQSRSLSPSSQTNEYGDKKNSNSVMDDTTSTILATLALVNAEDKTNNIQAHHGTQNPHLVSKERPKPITFKFTPEDAVTSLVRGQPSNTRPDISYFLTSTDANPLVPSERIPPLESKPPFANTILYSEDSSKKPSTPYSFDRASLSTSQATEPSQSMAGLEVSSKSTDTLLPRTTEDASVNTVDVKSKSEEVSKTPIVDISRSSSTVRVYSPSEPTTQHTLITENNSDSNHISASFFNATPDTLTSDVTSEAPSSPRYLSSTTAKWTSEIPSSPFETSIKSSGQTITTEAPGELVNASGTPLEKSSISIGSSSEYSSTSEINRLDKTQTTRRMDHSEEYPSVDYTTIASTYSVRFSSQGLDTTTSGKTYGSSSSLQDELSSTDGVSRSTTSFTTGLPSSTTEMPSSGSWMPSFPGFSTSNTDSQSSSDSPSTSDIPSSSSELPISPSDSPSSTVRASGSTSDLPSSISTSQGTSGISSSSELPGSSSTETMNSSTEETSVSMLFPSTSTDENSSTSDQSRYSVSHQVTVTSVTSSVSQTTGGTASTTPMPPTTFEGSSSPTTESSSSPSDSIEKSHSESTTSFDLEIQSQTSSPAEPNDTSNSKSIPSISPTTFESVTVSNITDTEITTRFSQLLTNSTTIASTTKMIESEHEDELPDVGLNSTSLDSTSSDDLESDIDEGSDKDHSETGLFNETDFGPDYTTTQGKTNDIMVASSSTPSGLTKHLPTEGPYENMGPESPDNDLYDGVMIPPRVIRLKINASQNDVCQGKEQLRDSIVKMFKLKQRTLDKNHINFLNLDKTSCSPRGRSINAIVDLQFQDSRGRYDRDLTDTFINLYDKGFLQYKYAVTEVSEKGIEGMDPTGDMPSGTSASVIAAIVISSVAAACLVFLTILLVILRKRQKGFNYGQRCTPVSLDDYSLDNISVYNSVRRKALRASKRSYGNPAFEDPGAISHPVNFASLANFVGDRSKMNEEFSQIATVAVKPDELPEGAETKNRYANVIPLPETRVQLKGKPGDTPADQYINANYVKGVKGADKFYIACQAPLSDTVSDFWQMVWEQQSRMIIMLTDLVENGVEKCANYLPASEVLDCHRVYGDLQVTLKKREVREKYIISHLQLKNLESNLWREVTHMWYVAWPVQGVPEEPSSVIAFLVEARSYIKTKESSAPIVVHCSPGTGRTGAIIAIDISIREFETNRSIDIPKTVYGIRRNRAGAVQTKDQYAFIYQVLHLYATKLTGGALDSI